MREAPQKQVETKLLGHVPCCHMSGHVRRVPVLFLPGIKTTWGLAEVCWTFSQYSAISDTPIPQERSDTDSNSTPNPADTSSAQAYSFTWQLFSSLHLHLAPFLGILIVLQFHNWSSKFWKSTVLDSAKPFGWICYSAILHCQSYLWECVSRRGFLHNNDGSVFVLR